MWVVLVSPLFAAQISVSYDSTSGMIINKKELIFPSNTTFVTAYVTNFIPLNPWDGSLVTNFPVSALTVSTNLWVTNTPIYLGTNFSAVLSANTSGGISGVGGTVTTTEQFSQLFIKATGDITFTNPVAFMCNDYVDTRLITNGNVAIIGVDVIPGLATNLSIVQFK